MGVTIEDYNDVGSVVMKKEAKSNGGYNDAGRLVKKLENAQQQASDDVKRAHYKDSYGESSQAQKDAIQYILELSKKDPNLIKAVLNSRNNFGEYDVLAHEDPHAQFQKVFNPTEKEMSNPEFDKYYSPAVNIKETQERKKPGYDLKLMRELMQKNLGKVYEE